MTTFLIDTSERAATPKYECGIFRLTVPDERTDEYVEALELLGFTPMGEDSE